jgi:hydantoinase/carbamoylase family amidase
MHASGVWAGVTPLEEAWNLADIMNPSTTTKAELQRHGYLGELTCSSASYPLGAHFELHIEQGPILEGSNKKVGVVSGAQAYRWLTVTVDGRDAHTGTTPFNARKDPLLAAAKMVVHSNELAKERGALASTGVFKLPMGSSTNTLPAQVVFTLDIRHPSHEVVKEIHSKCIEGFNKIAMEDGKGVDVTIEVETDSPEIKFHPDCREAIRKAANAVVGEDGSMDIMSGAGHDSVYTSRICPTGMIFVQCKDGVSHHPTEYCSPEDW